MRRVALPPRICYNHLLSTLAPDAAGILEAFSGTGATRLLVLPSRPRLYPTTTTNYTLPCQEPAGAADGNDGPQRRMRDMLPRASSSGRGVTLLR